MNIFWRELKNRRKAQIWWAIGMLVFMALSVAKFDTLPINAEATEALFTQFPASVQAIFGMTGLNLATISGYFGVLFIYLLIILSIHAGMLGADIVADEEIDKTSEFLYVKPRSRSQILFAKMVAGLLCVAVLWLVVLASTWVAIGSVKNVGSFHHDFGNFMAALAIVQLVFFFIGSACAAIFSNPKIASKIIAALVFASYIVFALIKFAPQIDGLKIISIFSYFDALAIIQKGALDPLYVGICLALVGISTALAFTMYNRRDMRV